MGLRNHQRFVCCRGLAATAIPLAVGGRDSGGTIGRHVSGDIDAGLLRDGFGESGIGCGGGGQESGGCER